MLNSIKKIFLTYKNNINIMIFKKEYSNIKLTISNNKEEQLKFSEF